LEEEKSFKVGQRVSSIEPLSKYLLNNKGLGFVIGIRYDYHTEKNMCQIKYDNCQVSEYPLSFVINNFKVVEDDSIEDETCESEHVNHPAHYNNGLIEVIDIIDDASLNEGFCVGNVIKYILRAPHKGSELEDLKKAKWYLERRISHLEDL